MRGLDPPGAGVGGEGVREGCPALSGLDVVASIELADDVVVPLDDGRLVGGEELHLAQRHGVHEDHRISAIPCDAAGVDLEQLPSQVSCEELGFGLLRRLVHVDIDSCGACREAIRVEGLVGIDVDIPAIDSLIPHSGSDQWSGCGWRTVETDVEELVLLLASDGVELVVRVVEVHASQPLVCGLNEGLLEDGLCSVALDDREIWGSLELVMVDDDNRRCGGLGDSHAGLELVELRPELVLPV